MGKAINKKIEVISMLINQFKGLIDLKKDKVSECLTNEYYFKGIEEDLEEIKDDFEELNKFYFNLGAEFRRFVIECDINHNINIISKNIFNIFFKEKPFIYLSKEKINDDIIDNTDDNTPVIDNNQYKKDIKNAIKQDENQNNEKMKKMKKKKKIKIIRNKITENNE